MDDKLQKARKRICVALDVDSIKEALELTDKLMPFAGIFKVGKSLHLRASLEKVDIISEIQNRGGLVFLDLKAHDTPDQIYRFSKEVARSGTFMFTIHIGSKEMNNAATKGTKDAAKELGIKAPLVIGVTELSSLDDKDLNRLGNRFSYDEALVHKAKIALEDGLDGLVCPASKVPLLKEFEKDLLFVTPGIKMNGVSNTGQKQLIELKNAAKASKNSILVIGSAYTKAKDIDKRVRRGLDLVASFM